MQIKPCVYLVWMTLIKDIHKEEFPIKLYLYFFFFYSRTQSHLSCFFNSESNLISYANKVEITIKIIWFSPMTCKSFNHKDHYCFSWKRNACMQWRNFSQYLNNFTIILIEYENNLMWPWIIGLCHCYAGCVNNVSL